MLVQSYNMLAIRQCSCVETHLSAGSVDQLQ